MAKDCLSNFKLLCFIPLNQIENFYNLIKAKYGVIFRNFFDYFTKNYIKGKLYDKTIWNYYTAIPNNLNDDILYFTNNIVESFNSIINNKFIGFCPAMYNYKNTLTEVISLYEMKNVYKEKKLSLTRALQNYVKSKNDFDLMDNNDIKKIKANYKDYLKNIFIFYELRLKNNKFYKLNIITIQIIIIYIKII